MICVEFSKDESTRSLRLNISGHAGSGEKGNDLVCASASMLAYTLGQNLEISYGMGILKGRPEIILDEGIGELSCECVDDEGYAFMSHTYLVIEAGYALLQHNFPQNVELKMFDQDGKS